MGHEDTTYANESVQSADHDRQVEQVVTHTIGAPGADGSGEVTVPAERPILVEPLVSDLPA